MNKVFWLWLLALGTIGCLGEFSQGTIEVNPADNQGDLSSWEYGEYYPGAILEANWPLCSACITREDCGNTMSCINHDYCARRSGFCDLVTRGGRDPATIDTVVIHTLEGYYNIAVDFFQDTSNGVSIHYLVGSDGKVGHLLSEYVTGKHAGNLDTDKRSVGIEVEGFSNYPQYWYTQAMYQSTAQLVYYLTQKYKIPADRRHIIGHWEIADAYSSEWCGGWGNHKDPGTGWDWEYFMQLVKQQDITWNPADWNSRPEVKGTLIDLDAPKTLYPGDRATVRITLRNDGLINWEEGRVGFFTLPVNQRGPFVNYDWIGYDRPTVNGQGCYGPMTEATFSFVIRAPYQEQIEAQDEFYLEVRNRSQYRVVSPDAYPLNVQVLRCDRRCPYCDHLCNDPSRILCAPEGSTTYRQCEENDRGCRIWGLELQSCPENKICLQGQCVPYPCLNECADETAILCWPVGGSDYHTCQKDEHGCLRWSEEVFSCPDPLVCRGGFCLPTCENECSDEAAILCSPEGSANYRTCVKAVDGCLRWGEELFTCAEKLTCSDSKCVH